MRGGRRLAILPLKTEQFFFSRQVLSSAEEMDLTSGPMWPSDQAAGSVVLPHTQSHSVPAVAEQCRSHKPQHK